MVTIPTIMPDATSTSLLALLVLVEDAEVAVAVVVTLVQLDAVPFGTVALADRVKSAHCHNVHLNNIHKSF